MLPRAGRDVPVPSVACNSTPTPQHLQRVPLVALPTFQFYEAWLNDAPLDTNPIHDPRAGAGGRPD